MVSLEVDHLKIGFCFAEPPIIAVDDVSFLLAPGKTLALLGESGCGKSITALGLMRLLPLHARYGALSKIKYAQEDILELPEYVMQQLRGRHIAMIFQEPMTALNPVLKIEHQLAEAINAHNNLSKKEVKKRLLHLLEKVEIDHPALRLTQYPHQLSGGQKQRIMIAMALANNPEVLIADEPTTALDVTIQAQILKLLKKLQQENNMSILLITHDLGVVKAAADNVCVMYAGQIVETAEVASFFQQVKHPYSQHLLASVPHIQQRNKHLPILPGMVPALGEIAEGCRFHPRCPYVFSTCKVKMPLLQTLGDREVRCHLYPEKAGLPPETYIPLIWTTPLKKEVPLLTVKSLSVYFKAGHLFSRNRTIIKAVDNVSFQLFPRQTLALVGESGCGKTTISRALLRLQPVHAGEIIFKNSNIQTLKSEALRHYRKSVQIIFQDPYAALNPRLTIADILAEGMIAQGMSKAFIQKKTLVLLEQVKLPAVSLTRYPHQFSGGQRQRICIARALALEPEVLICDEPTSALDVSVQAQILNLLKELQTELGVAYLFITHNMSVVSYLADDILVMQQGKMVEYDHYERILLNPQQSYTKKLLSSVLEISP